MGKLITEVVKGYNAYSVQNAKGEVVATSHIVQVQNGRYTILIGGRWAGIRSEAEAVARLTAIAEAC